MTGEQEISFIDNPAIQDRAEKYLCVDVDIQKVLNSWRSSLYAFEWITPEGRIKEIQELAESEQQKRRAIEQKLRNGETLAKPVLGIGILENVEIGIGRHEFLTAASRGLKRIPVHIPKSNHDDFTPFLS